MRRLAFAILVLAACSSEGDAEAPLPLAEAERARGLRFLHEPRVVTRTKESYAEERGRAITDEEVTNYRTVFGRLGYVPADFDLRAASKTDVSRIAAFYDPTDDGQITKFGNDDHPVVIVHELVHALQDQHFDLDALDASASSSDEVLAGRALAEGDARVAEIRYFLESSGHDPLVEGRQLISTGVAREQAEQFLSNESVPPIMSAYFAFCYAYGAIVVADAIGLHEQPARWSTSGADALFRGAAPRSTEGILRTALGIEIDPIVDVGMVRLPAALADRYEMRAVDRLGAWLAWILLRQPSAFDPSLAVDWDGDQLVVIGSKNSADAPSAVVWTTAWENEIIATKVADDLQRMHAAAAEPTVIERRGAQVVFAKGAVPADDIRLLADAALYDRTSGSRAEIRGRAINLDRFFDAHRARRRH